VVMEATGGGFVEEEDLLDDFLISLEDYVPAIPDEVVAYFLTKTGFVCPDPRVKRLVSLAAQKFVADVANDALQYCKIRQQSPAFRDKRQGKGKRLVLTMDDLSQALEAYGINVKKPDYYVDPSHKSPGGTAELPTAGSANGAPPAHKKQKQTP